MKSKTHAAQAPTEYNAMVNQTSVPAIIFIQNIPTFLSFRICNLVVGDNFGEHVLRKCRRNEEISLKC